MLTFLAALALIAWLVVVLHRAPPRDLLPDGDDTGGDAPEAWPDVAIIVPARNEADSLPRTLPLLLAQDYPGPWRVIVVDERSTDGTDGVARGIAHDIGPEAEARLDVVEGQPLPPRTPGWAGKVWGMQQGLARAGVLDAASSAPQFVLFTDADIAHAPGSLRLLVAESLRNELDLNSRMALLRCDSPAERLLIPAFLFFFATLYPMRRVNDPASRIAASAGGCQLLSASSLARMNGVEPIASCRIDDVNLARAVKARGGRLRLACSRENVVSLRDYPALGDVWRMVRRSAFEELRFSWLRLLACMAALALVFIVPPAAVAFGGLVARGLGAAAWTVSAVAYVPAVRHFGLPAWRALTLPVAGVLYGAMTLDSALRHAAGRAEAWRAPAA